MCQNVVSISHYDFVLLFSYVTKIVTTFMYLDKNMLTRDYKESKSMVEFAYIACYIFMYICVLLSVPTMTLENSFSSRLQNWENIVTNETVGSWVDHGVPIFFESDPIPHCKKKPKLSVVHALFIRS